MYRCRPTDANVNYVYIGDCGDLYDLECGADCHWCSWSYPQGDPLGAGSPNASCRCPANVIKETAWGDTCANANDGRCGSYCKECRHSWLPYEGQTAESA